MANAVTIKDYQIASNSVVRSWKSNIHGFQGSIERGILISTSK